MVVLYFFYLHVLFLIIFVHLRVFITHNKIQRASYSHILESWDWHCLCYWSVFLIASILDRALLTVGAAPAFEDLASTFHFVGSIIFGGHHHLWRRTFYYPTPQDLCRLFRLDDKPAVPHWSFLVQSLPSPKLNFACYLGAVVTGNSDKNDLAGAL